MSGITRFKRLGMRSRIGVLLFFLGLATCSTEVSVSAQDVGSSSWRSFDLIYYDPAAKPNTLSPFNVDARSEFTTEMRVEYLRRYAEALVQRTGKNNPKYFAFDVVPAEEARERAAQIKEKPTPKIRQMHTLKYWRWKMEPEAGPGGQVRDVSWVVKEFEDELLWSAMEVPRMFSYDRAVHFRTHFRGPLGQRVLLSIGSIIDVFEIWVNGRHVGRHSGFEPVTFDITQFVEQGVDNTLALRIENKPKDQIGIADEIYVLGVSDPYLSDVFVKTDRAQGREAHATLEVEVTQIASPGAQARVKVEITPWFPQERGEPVFSDVLPLQLSGQGPKKARATLHLRNIDLWSPDAPHLYLVRATLQDGSGNARDELLEVTGFRRIEQRQGRLFLNGRPWFMKSFGETLGFAPGVNFMGEISPPDDWIARDFILAKKANANTIRLHPWGFTGDIGKYNELGWPVWGMPNSSTNYQRIAWIADQLGIGLVWGTRLWTLWGSSFQSKYADETWQARVEPSLRHVRNRPSIIVYEGLNEVGPLFYGHESKMRGYMEQRYEQFIQRYFELVNRTDDSRLVIPDSYWGGLAHSRAPNDSLTVQAEGPFRSLKTYTLVENTFWTDHNYFGWYRNLPERFLLDKVQARPFIQFESGAEAMPDWRLYRGLRWHGIWLNNGGPSGSIEQQRLGRPLRILQDSEVNISQANQGLSIVQTTYATRFSGVVDGINVNLIADGLAEGNYRKGVCDIYRKAKLGYFAAQMAFQPLVAVGKGFDFVLGSGDPLHLQVAADAHLGGKRVQLTVEVVDESGGIVDKKQTLLTLDANQRVSSAGDYAPRFRGKGFYLLRYTLTEQK